MITGYLSNFHVAKDSVLKIFFVTLKVSRPDFHQPENSAMKTFAEWRVPARLTGPFNKSLHQITNAGNIKNPHLYKPNIID